MPLKKERPAGNPLPQILQSEFQVSLDYMKLYLKKINKEEERKEERVEGRKEGLSSQF